MSRIKFLLPLFMLCCCDVFAQNNGLDPSFGNGGIVTNIQTNKKFKTPSDLLIQPDGKILVTGEFVARFTSTGKLDSSFDGGKLIDGAPGLCPLSGFVVPNSAFGTSLLVQPDGKVIATATAHDNLQNSNTPFVIRFNVNGSIDSIFGKNGIATLCCGHYAVCSALQPDGKVVIAGDGDYSAIVTRLNADGTIDSSFGGKGYVETHAGIYQGHISGVGLLPDGRIAIGGTGYDPSRRFGEVVLRFLPDGRPDSSLGGTGIIYPLRADYCRAFLVLPDGKMLLSLAGLGGGDAIGCLKMDGNVDSSFGISGFAEVHSDKLYRVLPLADGRLLYCGSYNGDYVVGRLKKDGIAADSSFGVNGWLTTDITGYTRDYAYALVLQADGKIVLAGNGNTSNVNPPMMTLVRYKANAAAGLPEIEYKGRKISLRPSPAADKVEILGIAHTEILEIGLVDASGKVIKRIAAPRSTEIPLPEHIPAGQYYLRITPKAAPATAMKLLIQQ